MTFSIATVEQTEAPQTRRTYDGRVTFRNFAERADRKQRQIIAAIEICETAQEVNDTMTEHGEVLDALFLDYPDMLEAIETAAADHKAILAAGSDPTPDAGAPAPIPATAQSNVLNKAF